MFLRQIFSVKLFRLFCIAILFSTQTLFAQGVTADLQIANPDGGHYDSGDSFIATLLIFDEDGNNLRIDQFEDNGLRVLELWVSGPRHNYNSVGRYVEFVILSTRNGFNGNSGFDPETGEIEIELPRNGLENGTYTVIFEIERQFQNGILNIFPYADFQVGQDEPTITNSIRYLSCNSDDCHEAPSQHNTDDLTNCIICHTHDYNFPWDDIMHSLREHQDNDVEGDCTDCHRANADIDKYGFTACTSCHRDTGHGHPYANCNDCHWGEIYRWMNEFTPSSPRAFDLVSPDNRDEIEGQPVSLSWEESPNNDEGDIITYEVKLGLDSRFRNYVTFDAGESTSIDIDGIDYNRNYYWRVRASDLNQLGRNSSQNWRFSVVVPGQTIAFRNGWNLISFNISPVEEFWTIEDGPDVELIVEQLRIDEDNLPVEIVKDELGRFFVPEFGFNSILYWNLEDGYQVKTTAEIESTFEGSLIPADTDIPLGAGWNLIPYYPLYDLMAEAPDFDALAPIIDHVRIAKDIEGNFLMPELEFSNMLPWSPGNAYQVYVDADVVLNYARERNAVASFSTLEKENKSGHWRSPSPTDENMSLLVKEINGLTPQLGDQIAVVNKIGRIVGVGNVDEKGLCGISVWGDDKSTKPVDGMLKGELLGLKLWDSDKNIVINLKALSKKKVIYVKDSFVVINAIAKVENSRGYFVSPAYQNPFNAVTKIDYLLPEATNVTVSVCDINGKTVATLQDGVLKAGSYNSVWDARSSASGLYFVRFESDLFNHAQKVMLLK
ncbi:MAG: T9SS type A sorting domain-containing protein [Calditrichaeota bacterium]|nr:T9SS type A sorting domain-containing protein [Calditrichota bacterium]